MTLVSFLIPLYNESDDIAEVVARVLAAPLPEGTEREIVLVDDGSTDGTAAVLKNFAGLPNIHVHRFLNNHGKGWAIRAGLPHVRGEIVIIQDGDNEYDPNDLEDLVRPIVQGECAIAYGSRFLGSISGMKFENWLVNKLLVAAVALLYGVRITDEATAYKVFRTDVLRSFALNCKRFEFCPEVTAKAIRSGHSIREVPITYHGRGINAGKKIRWWDAVEAFWTLPRYRFWKPRLKTNRSCAPTPPQNKRG